MKKQTRLNDRWITFIKIILDPWIIILGIFLLLIISSVKHSENINIHLFAILLIAIISGIIGAVFIKKWIDLHDEHLLINRGASAIRNLKLIYFNLLRTEKRIRIYIKKLDENNPAYELADSFFEEIIEKCRMLQEECINSISIWSDLIKDADAKTILTNIYNLKERKEKLARDILQLKKDFFEAVDREKISDEDFEKQMAQKEFDLKELSSRILESEDRINHSILSGMTETTFIKDSNTSLSDFKIQEN